jgi:hypothetical protein
MTLLLQSVQIGEVTLMVQGLQIGGKLTIMMCRLESSGR